jgi:WD40 repeat protein
VDVDTETYTLIGEFNGHTDRVRSVAFSQDGRQITSGSIDQTVCVWQTNTGRLIAPLLEGHTDVVNAVAVSADDTQIISGGDDKTVRIWSRSTRDKWPTQTSQITTLHPSERTSASVPLHAISLEGGPSVVSACYSPDFTLYAASTLDGHVSLWHIKRGLLWESNTPIHPIHLLTLSADRLIISSPDGSILAWNMVEGKPTQKTPVTSGPQIDTVNIQQFRSKTSSYSVVRWIPFKEDAGSWVYVDGVFIRFEDVGGGSVTFIDVDS